MTTNLGDLAQLAQYIGTTAANAANAATNLYGTATAGVGSALTNWPQAGTIMTSTGFTTSSASWPPGPVKVTSIMLTDNGLEFDCVYGRLVVPPELLQKFATMAKMAQLADLVGAPDAGGQ